MDPTVVIEPNLFAIPSVADTSERVTDIIRRVVHWEAAVRECQDVHICKLSNTIEILQLLNAFPSQPNIEALIDLFSLGYKFSPNDVRRVFNSLLTRTENIERLTGVHGVEYDDWTDSLGTDAAYEATDSINACRQVMAHIGVVYANAQALPKLIAMVVAIPGTVPPSTNISFKLTACGSQLGLCVPSDVTAEIPLVTWYDSFCSFLDASAVWDIANSPKLFGFAVALASAKILKARGAEADFRSLRSRCVIGSEFVLSLKRVGAMAGGPFSGVVLDSCARVLLGMPKHAASQFLQANGRDQVVAIDGSTGWRTHVTKGGPGLRLMYWQAPNDKIEFANVAVKDDVVISPRIL